MILFKRNSNEIHQCIYLNPSANEYYLFTKNKIHFSTNSINNQIRIDQFNSNKYYLFDSLSNIYILLKFLQLIRPYLSNDVQSSNGIQSIKGRPLNTSFEFVHLIKEILHRNDRFSSILSSTMNLSDSQFEKILFQYEKLFFKDFIKKQEKAQIELEKKKRTYLDNLQQTQQIAYQELIEKFEKVKLVL